MHTVLNEMGDLFLAVKGEGGWVTHCVLFGELKPILVQVLVGEIFLSSYDGDISLEFTSSLSHLAFNIKPYF